MIDEKKVAGVLVEKTELESIEERRAARRSATEAAREAQYVIDMRALDGLEEEHGDGQVAAIHVQAFVKGLPTMVIVKSPAGSGAYKRFQDKVREAKGHAGAIGAAQDMLAEQCIVYPADPGLRKAMFDAYPNMLNDAATAAAKLVQFKTEAEKKG